MVDSIILDVQPIPMPFKIVFIIVISINSNSIVNERSIVSPVHSILVQQTENKLMVVSMPNHLGIMRVALLERLVKDSDLTALLFYLVGRFKTDKNVVYVITVVIKVFEVLLIGVVDLPNILDEKTLIMTKVLEIMHYFAVTYKVQQVTVTKSNSLVKNAQRSLLMEDSNRVTIPISISVKDIMLEKDDIIVVVMIIKVKVDRTKVYLLLMHIVSNSNTNLTLERIKGFNSGLIPILQETTEKMVIYEILVLLVSHADNNFIDLDKGSKEVLFMGIEQKRLIHGNDD